MNDPSGRHDTHVEIWTAPTNIGEGTESDGWQQRQRCLAVANQMALVIPADVNRSKGKASAASSGEPSAAKSKM